jgi:peptide/nickel transport system substrate-binding protein
MRLRVLLFCAALAASAGAAAKNFRWAAQGDANTMDPHAVNEAFTNGISAMAYDTLLARGKDMALLPWLATSWEAPAPNRWIFHLRKDAQFHDGTPLTADDVIFSFERASQAGSSFRTYALQAGTPRKLDEHAVEFTTPAPNPVMLDTVSTIFIMSKAWCERHGVTRPQNYRAREETHASRHAMGTGPYRLVARDTGVKVLHRRNPHWWGTAHGLYEGNVDTVEFRPIASAATRAAALKSGELDFVLDPAAQDVGWLRKDSRMKVLEGPENRVVFIGLDQDRDELLHSDVKGANPFRDRRVRLALYHALDPDALHRHVMRGASIITGIALPDPVGAGIPREMDVRHAFDPGKARQLLAEAGYQDGFSFTLHCPNDRVINDERLCNAIAAMWSQVGLRVKAEIMTKALLGPRLLRRDVSAYLGTFGSASPDAIFTLKPVWHSPSGAGAGVVNFGNVRNGELDRLIDAIEVEMNAASRQAMIARAIGLLHENAHAIPLHRQVIPWAMQSNVSAVHRPNNILNPVWVRIQ